MRSPDVAADGGGARCDAGSVQPATIRPDVPTVPDADGSQEDRFCQVARDDADGRAPTTASGGRWMLDGVQLISVTGP